MRIQNTVEVNTRNQIVQKYIEYARVELLKTLTKCWEELAKLQIEQIEWISIVSIIYVKFLYLNTLIKIV